MRKAALVTAVVLAAAFSSTPSSAQSAPPTPDEIYNLNKSTHMFLQGPMSAAAESAAAPAGAKYAKKKAKKKVS